MSEWSIVALPAGEGLPGDGGTEGVVSGGGVVASAIDSVVGVGATGVATKVWPQFGQRNDEPTCSGRTR